MVRHNFKFLIIIENLKLCILNKHMQEFSEKDIPNIASLIIGKITDGFSLPEKATIVAFSGELGAGKTTLIKEIAKQFRITEIVTSPTFTIMKFYEVKPQLSQKLNFKKLIHIDAYRLKSSNDLLKLGWSDISTDPKNIIFVEWPECVGELIQDPTFKITLTHKDESTRIIELE